MTQLKKEKTMKSLKIRLWLLILVSFFIVGLSIGVHADNLTNNYGIVIDADFSDWQDKPKVNLTTLDDKNDIKQASLLVDESNIYIFIDMHPAALNTFKQNWTLQPAGYKLTIGGKVFWLTFTQNSNGKKGWLDVQCWAEDNSVNRILSDATARIAHVSTSLGNDDIMECQIPLTDFKVLGGSQETTLSNSNLGTQVLTANGGSTGPIVLSVIGFAIVGTSLYFLKKK